MIQYVTNTYCNNSAVLNLKNVVFEAFRIAQGQAQDCSN